jgi:hypothetical protein
MYHRFEAYEKKNDYCSHWVIVECYGDGRKSDPLFPCVPQGDSKEELVSLLKKMLEDISGQSQANMKYVSRQHV